MFDTVKKLMSRLSGLALEDLPAIRRVLLHSMLGLSIVTCLMVLVGPTGGSILPEHVGQARAMMAVWMAVHVIVFLAHRKWPQAAVFAFVTLSPGTLTYIMELTPFGPQAIIGGLFTYHAALSLMGLVLLDFRHYAVYITLTGAHYINYCFHTLQDQRPDAAVGFVTPLVGHWMLSVLVSWLMDKHNRRIVSRHETLEAELERRLGIIEAQNQRLLQQEKLSAVGRLAGGIAHDFNNIMTVVKINAGRIATQHETEHPSAASARSISDAVDRGSELTEQLLGFARRGKHRNSPLDLHGIVDSVIRIIGRTVDRRIEVRRQCDATWTVVMGDPSQMHQVVMNLAINAVDAMPTGGELSIGTSDSVDEDAAAEAGLPPGRYVRVVVQDTGGTMSSEAMEHLFEPYYTTKAAPGHGLGLAMVYGIVTNHGGWIGAQTDPGEQTTFEILLPAIAQATAAPEETRSVVPSQGKGSILVVDDEQAILDAVGTVLVDLGYTVLTAADGKQALEIYRENDRGIDLILLDLTMPVMDGVECFDQIRRTNPDQRIVIATGHTRDGILQDLRRKGAVDVLLKPYDAVKLSECVSSHVGETTAQKDTA